MSTYRPPWTFKIGFPVRVIATSWRLRRWKWTETRGAGAKAREPRVELNARDFCMVSDRADQRRPAGRRMEWSGGWEGLEVLGVDGLAFRRFGTGLGR